MIYLDHNASTPIHPRVLESMLPFLREQWGNPSSPYRFGTEARAAVEQARARIAGCIACAPAEITFCASGTESDNLALRGVAHARRDRGKHIVTSAIEHSAVFNTCKALEQEGYRVTYLPVSQTGVVEIDALSASICDETVLISVMHANNETGVIQPVEQIAAVAKARGVLFHTDAVQTAGKLPGRLGEIGADLLTFSGHKIYAPKGVAALYVKKGTSLSPTTTGGIHEHGLRAGTENVAGIVGLAEALRLAVESSEAEGLRLHALRKRLESQINSLVPMVKINGAQAARVPNTSNMSFQSVDGESIVLGMDLQGFCVSTGSACSTGSSEPSRVLLAMGLSAREAQGSIRISLGRDTKENHIEATVSALAKTVERLRSISSAGRQTA